MNILTSHICLRARFLKAQDPQKCAVVPKLFSALTCFALMTSALISSVSVAAETLDTNRCPAWLAKIESSESQLQLKYANTSNWQDAEIGEIICSGDQIQTTNGRAAIRLQNQSLVRLNAHTSMYFANPDKEKPLLELIKGVFYLFTRTPRQFEFATPYAYENASVDGTEFSVSSDPVENVDRIEVYEGTVSLGKQKIAPGYGLSISQEASKTYAISSIRDSVRWALFYPSTISTNAQFAKVSEYAAQGNYDKARAALQELNPADLDADYFATAAALDLYAGLLESAQKNLERAISVRPNHINAGALMALINLIQGKSDQAKQQLDKLNQSEGDKTNVYLARSYWHQAQFNLEAALSDAKNTVNAQPASSIAWARQSELALMLGKSKLAQQSAEKAITLAPQNALAHSSYAFVLLQQLKFTKARQAFEKAITIDSSLPTAHFGLGLINIRKNNLVNGREKIELAVALAPGQALFRSYLGKAYAEENQPEDASEQFQLAKQLDPNDPTPWFYAGLMAHTQNKPYEALAQLGQSVELNDKRAVYRSRLLLDADEASRVSSQANVYRELGFDIQAVQSASKSIHAAPNEHGGHRLLAEIYKDNPRFDAARSSEILQAQMLQPLTATPLQSALAEQNLLVLDGSGPGNIGNNEFTPLFNRERVAVQVAGGGGSNSTEFGEWQVSGLEGPVSFAVGQYKYRTDGFEDRNRINYDIDSAFLQVALSPKLNVQLEARQREESFGDEGQLFANDESAIDRTSDGKNKTGRIGARYSFNPSNDFLISGDYKDIKQSFFNLDEFTTTLEPPAPPLPALITASTTNSTEGDSKNLEFQWQSNQSGFNLISGVKKSAVDLQNLFTTQILSTVTDLFVLPESPPSILPIHTKIDYDNAYLYLYKQLNSAIDITLGAAYAKTVVDSMAGNEVFSRDISQWNPKLGLRWTLTDKVTLRTAAYRTLKQAQDIDQTLEPTQIMGFTQLYDGFNQSDSDNYALGFDYKLSSALSVGAEALVRESLDNQAGLNVSRQLTLEEDFFNGYVYWTLNKWAFSAKLIYEKQEESDDTNTGTVFKTTTKQLPLELQYFSDNGLSAGIKTSFVDQDGRFRTALGASSTQNESFWVVDFSGKYSFWRGKGSVELSVQNIFEEEFLFLQDTILQNDNERQQTSRFNPERTSLISVNFFF